MTVGYSVFYGRTIERRGLGESPVTLSQGRLQKLGGAEMVSHHCTRKNSHSRKR